MKKHRLTDGSILVGRQCEKCGRRVTSNQEVIYHKTVVGKLSYFFIVHVKCMEKVLGIDSETEFSKLRDLIVSTGELFPPRK